MTAEGHPERAARLFGAVEALLAATSTTIYPTNQADYDRNLAATRAGLEPSVFAASLAEGKLRAIEPAVAFALQSDPP